MTNAPGRVAGIAAFARHDPDRVALELEHRQVTYAQLDLSADRLAQALIEESAASAGASGGAGGAGPGDARDESQVCIPLMVGDTESLMVGVEAIARAGMVVVPIDP
ncbi:MAG: hypothetical protein ACRDV4_09425, partial [Acidimicrobiales bacterium]